MTAFSDHVTFMQGKVSPSTIEETLACKKAMGAIEGEVACSLHLSITGQMGMGQFWR